MSLAATCKVRYNIHDQHNVRLGKATIQKFCRRLPEMDTKSLTVREILDEQIARKLVQSIHAIPAGLRRIIDYDGNIGQAG